MLGLAQRRRKREARNRAELVAALRAAAAEPKVKSGSALRTARAVTWRLRRQFAPLAVICGLWLAGVAVDATDAAAGAVLLVSVLAAGVLWRLRYAPRLDRDVERVYAASCLAGGVAWLAVVAVVGLG